jgi:hypothetical protein
MPEKEKETREKPEPVRITEAEYRQYVEEMRDSFINQSIFAQQGIISIERAERQIRVAREVGLGVEYYKDEVKGVFPKFIVKEIGFIRKTNGEEKV